MSDLVTSAPVSGAENCFKYADLQLRVMAAMIDGLFYLAMNLIEYLLVSTSIIVKDSSIFNAITMLAGIIYECGFLASSWMATPGMRAVGIKIVDYNGNRISLGRAFVRYLSQFLSMLILMIGFLMIGFDRRCQGLHDKIAKTLVIIEK